MSASSWPVQLLAETATLYDSLHKTPSYSNEGYPMIRVTDIRRGFVDTTQAKRVDRKTYLEFSKKHKPEVGDVVFSRVGSYGNSSYVNRPEEFCLGQNTVCISPNRKLVDPRFFYLCLNAQFVRDQVDALVGGASQPTISLENIKSLRIPQPPLTTQCRLADILFVYDELMENCQRRIQILEGMARTLYREWFLYFRFTGHEKIPRVDSPLGPVPKGWEVKRIGNAFKTVLGGTPARSKPEFWQNGTIAWINSGKTNDLRITEPSELITELGLEKSAAKVMPRGTTVIAITGATLGQVSYLEIDASANQSVVGIVDQSGRLSEWIYLFFKERIDEIIQHASGGAQQHINKEIVDNVQVVIPASNVANQFKQIVAPIFLQLANLLFKVHKLRRSRDLLLPMLLSGRVVLDTRAEQIAA